MFSGLCIRHFDGWNFFIEDVATATTLEKVLPDIDSVSHLADFCWLAHRRQAFILS